MHRIHKDKATTRKSKAGDAPSASGHLSRASREYLAAKSEREAARLLGHQARPASSRHGRGKSLRASNRWQKWEMRLPGTMSDSVVAKKIGRTTEAVKSHRMIHGIPPFNRQRRWIEEEDKILRQFSRKEAARRLGRPLHAIQYRLKQLRSGAQLGGPSRTWTKNDQSLLGKHSDTVVARRLCRSVNSVRWKRKALGIPSHGDPGRRWTRQEEKLLGTMPDMDVARKINRSYGAVYVHRSKLGIPGVFTFRPWTPEEDALLGTMPDAELARRFGSSREHVGLRHRKKGLAVQLGRTLNSIKLRRSKYDLPPFNPKLRPWNKDHLALLGRMPDAEVAARTGHPLGSVREKRQSLGIKNPQNANRPSVAPDSAAIC